MAKMLGKSEDKYEAHFTKLSVFIGQKSIFHNLCTQNIRDIIQIRVYKINNEGVVHFCQFIHLKVRKSLRKSQAQFREKLRKLRLMLKR